MDSPRSTFLSPMEQLYSGETDESPFGSNLVTPTDEQVLHFLQPNLSSTIDERITVAKATAYYLGSEDDKVTKERDLEVIPKLDAVMSESPFVDGFPPSPSRRSVGDRDSTDDAVKEQNTDESNLSTYDSSPSFPSPHPSALEIAKQARLRSNVLYSLPNAHISIDEGMSHSESNDEGDDTIILVDPFMTENTESTPDLMFSLVWPKDVQTMFSYLTLHNALLLAAQILLFFPWCVAVGGAIFISPVHLSSLTFASSLNYISPPLMPVQRYAHWADYGLQHITIFLCFLFAIVWMFPDAGWVVVGAFISQVCWAWHDFLPDRTVPVGEDERQTIYLLAKNTWLDGSSVQMQKVNGRYYATDFHLREAVADHYDSQDDLEEDL